MNGSNSVNLYFNSGRETLVLMEFLMKEVLTLTADVLNAENMVLRG